MEYHVDYRLDDVKENNILNEKNDRTRYIFYKNKIIWISIFIILGMLFFLSILHIINIEKINTLTNKINEQNNSDILINGLLNSENGKRFILSKIEELIINYEKNRNVKYNENNEINKIKNESTENLQNEENFNKHLNYNLKSNVTNERRYFKDSEKNIELNNVSFLLDHIEAVSKFHVFLTTYDKQYKTSSEMNQRFHNFLQNYKKIVEHNKKSTSYKKDINQFADLSEDEFKLLFLNYKSLPMDIDDVKSNELLELIEKIKLNRTQTQDNEDATFDWRKFHVVSDVKNQGVCGSCWAFSITGAVETQYAIKEKEIYNLSPQQLVDCSKENSGCKGGNLNLGYKYVYDEGLCKDEEYKYIGVENSCNKSACNQLFKINGYFPVPTNLIKKTIYYLGPISASLAASDEFTLYKEGIFDGSCSDVPNHAVLIIGFGVHVTNKTKIYYYILKNSWGTSWGEGGYMKIITNENGTLLKCSLGVREAFVPTL